MPKDLEDLDDTDNDILAWIAENSGTVFGLMVEELDIEEGELKRRLKELSDLDLIEFWLEGVH